jgi:hypothetical protein
MTLVFSGRTNIRAVAVQPTHCIRYTIAICQERFPIIVLKSNVYRRTGTRNWWYWIRYIRYIEKNLQYLNAVYNRAWKDNLVGGFITNGLKH